MCDTQVLIRAGAVWFAKNSDREPGEPQRVLRLAPVAGDPTARLRTTYLDIPQLPDRHGMILSQPVWLWGAEMGVNDRGVAIGNEAVFTRVMQRRPALLGMDLVRLGLERASSAREALAVITGLLQTHGQGGPTGYRDQRFHYDSSFLIADPQEAWVLETAARHWVAKRVDGSAALSNCLTIGTDYELHSAGLQDYARAQGLWDGRGELDFARTFDTRFLPHFAGARRRLALSRACLADPGAADWPRLLGQLRRHASGDDPLRGSNGDVCLHAMGYIRRSQTTGSQVSRLSAEGSRHLFTGSSAPCLSLFRPAAFDGFDYSVLERSADSRAATLWWRHEAVHRRALFDAAFRDELRRSRAAAEHDLLQLIEAGALHAADARAREWQNGIEAAAATRPLRPPLSPAGLYWRLQNRRDAIR